MGGERRRLRVASTKYRTLGRPVPGITWGATVTARTAVIACTGPMGQAGGTKETVIPARAGRRLASGMAWPRRAALHVFVRR